MKSLATALCALVLPLSVAAETAPLLPRDVVIHDFTVAADRMREFDVEVPRTTSWLPYELQAADESPLSGTLRISLAGGQPLREVQMNGVRIVGGVVPLPAASAAQRVRISVQAGAQALRADLTLVPARASLRSGQVMPVFARRAGQAGFSESFELRLAKASSVDLRTWGSGDDVRLQVMDANTEGFPEAVCNDAGDAWRRCEVPRLKAGVYHVTVKGSGAPVYLLASWNAVEP